MLAKVHVGIPPSVHAAKCTLHWIPVLRCQNFQTGQTWSDSIELEDINAGKAAATREELDLGPHPRFGILP